MTTDAGTQTLLSQTDAAVHAERRRVEDLEAAAANIMADLEIARLNGDDAEVNRLQGRYDATFRKTEAARGALGALQRKKTALEASHNRYLTEVKRHRWAEAKKDYPARVQAVKTAKAELVAAGNALANAAANYMAAASEHGGAISSYANLCGEFAPGKPQPENPVESINDVVVAGGVKMRDVLRGVTGTPGKASPMARMPSIMRLLGLRK